MKKFSLKRKTHEISVENEDGGESVFVLHEMTAARRDGYLNSLSKRTKVVNGAAAGLNSFDGIHAELLVLCMTQGDKPVTKEQVQEWPAGFVADVFGLAQELNGLNKKDEKEAPDPGNG